MLQSTYQERLENIKKMMSDSGLTQLYLSSYDSFLSEYVPQNNSLRVYLTGFTGSVAEVLVSAEGDSHLFVDGRYTQQAELQVDQKQFQIHTCEAGKSPFGDMLTYIQNSKLGFIPSRTSFADFKTLREKFDLVDIKSADVEKVLGLDYQPILNPIEWISPEKGGVETQRKLQRMNIKHGEAFLVTALDSLAWLSNGRGYHLPFMSSFQGTGLATTDKLFVFISEEISKESAWDKNNVVQWVSYADAKDRHQKILEVIKAEAIINLKFDPQTVNALDFEFFNVQCHLENIEPVSLLILKYQSIKFPEEIHIMRDEFLLASKAIYNTVGFVKQNWEGLSERDVYNKTSDFYKQQGGHSHSFNTIAGFAGNGSIMHYGSPSDELKLRTGEIFLLDSGGYFESGFATDKTRTFLIGESANDPLYKEIYTLVLKGLLGLQFHEFDENTLGKELDAVARKPLKEKGYDYNHGTGHGVGINVHEGGVRIHMPSVLPMKAGQVVSLEPGIYIRDKAGVRLENIAHVVKDEATGKLKFENLVFIGFDHDLIDDSLLTEQEKTWLEEYERECQTHGMSFKYPSQIS